MQESSVIAERSTDSVEGENTQAKKKYAAVGTGGRIPMFIDPLVRDYPQYAELVGLCDVSPTRANYHRERLQADYGYHDVPTYAAADFDRMIAETNPDVVIVCTMDSVHHEYIVRALDLGCDVVTEKPMTTDEEKCRAIVEAVERSGKHVRVSFNYRWTPGTTKVRELLASGVIGDIKHVNLEYQLNTSHGADYFRRWHSQKECSGGLLIHKSTHHFDLVNWWIDSIPSEVFAFGDLRFYGKENAIARGDEAYTGYERYSDAGDDVKEKDPFAFSMDRPSLKSLYSDAEAESGYVRDKNVFRAGINIEDTMSVLVKYRTGIVLTYSLVAYSPLEGYRVTFSGDRGRLEYTEMHASHIIAGQSDTELAKEQKEGGGHKLHIRVIPHFQEGYTVEVQAAEGSHGGGDKLIQEQIFSPNPPEESMGRGAGHEQGAASILIGVAANKSIATGEKVQIDDLCPLRPEAKHLSELV
jgi:predicted dehydrogenase